ncbi:hypothetical protein FSP39_019339 [Pinctada imbricata]|uniref:Uncharacterized protein n=1 Tax=Pinctada imbricata TaxID=66713 RepID=A0AA89BKU5_PINIB|nr:hypothetical protein FSP39_019339 [Pinctada imbricata]
MTAAFCGSRDGARSVSHGALQNECFVDVLNIIPHAIFVLISLFILIVWSRSLFYKIENATWSHYSGHNLRWVLTLLLILVSLVEIADGITSDRQDPDIINLHTILPQCIALISAILSIVFYHSVEQWNSPRFLLILLAYWSSALLLKIIKIISLDKNGMSTEHLRVWLKYIDTGLCAALTLVEINALRVMKYAFFKKPKHVKTLAEASETKFVHRYVNFLSKCTYWWLNDFLREGFKKPLEMENLGKLPESEIAETQFLALQKAFDEEKRRCANTNKQVCFHRVYLKAFWPMLALAGGLRLISDFLAFVGPYCIEHIINYAYRVTRQPLTVSSPQSDTSSVAYSLVSYSNVTTQGILVINGTTTEMPLNNKHYYNTVSEFFSNGYVLTVVMLLATTLQHSLLQNHHFLVIREGIRFRAAIQGMVFSKSLSLSTLTINSGKMTMGQIINHMSMDSNFMMMMFFFIHFIWSCPLTMIIALVLMYHKLGFSALIGGSIVILAGPIQFFVGRGMSRFQKKVMLQADKRVKKCNEVIQGIKVIKLLAWEGIFNEGITETRKQELKYLFIGSLFRILFSVSATAVPALGMMITFIIYPYLEDAPLDLGKAMSTLALFNVLLIPIVLFTLFCTTVITANVSAKRLVPFFLAEECEGIGGHSSKQHTATIGTETEENEAIKLDTFVEMRNGGGKTTLRKDDDLMSSQSSLGSTLSRAITPSHSRQNSRGSLLDIIDPHRRHSSTGLTSEVTKEPSSRRRHTSGVSTGDEEEIADCVTLVEPRMVIEISNGNFSYDLNTKEVYLRNVNLKIPTGKLTLIVGSVGSGKTSLLSAILGEMITVSGKVDVSRGTKIAYVAQKPWLLNKSLRDNILFGQNYTYRRYSKVIGACALQPDISTLPAGDLTEIGEKGVNLSGGQKQRISIARALYSSCDTVIMDDPFSALDAHVGKHVFEEAILHRMMSRKRTVILVTHQLQYLNHANNIIAMKNGEIQFQGKLADVKKQEPELYESWRLALREAKASESVSSAGKESTDKGENTDSSTDQSANAAQGHQSNYHRQSSDQSLGSHSLLGRHLSQLSNMEEEGSKEDCKQATEESEEKDPESSADKEKEEQKGTLIAKEHKETGAVSWHVYLRYVAACGNVLVAISLLCQIAYQGLLMGAAVVLSLWAGAATDFQFRIEAEGAGAYNNTTLPVFDNSVYTRTYIILNMTGVLGAFIAGIILYLTTIRASRNLHRDMLGTILHVPMRYFDVNPSGRIMNRFSSDMGQIDQKLPNTLDSLQRVTLSCLSALVMNALGTPYFLIAAVPLVILYYCLQRFFRASSRELQRLDSVTKSPLFSHFTETLSGLQTIRAFRAEKRFRMAAFAHINTNNTPFMFMHAINRWLGIRLDYLGSLLVFVAAVSSLSACFAGQSTPAYVGLSITYALVVTNYLNWIVRNSAEAEMLMNSVERVDEYIKLEREPTKHPDGNLIVDESWPEKGGVEYKNVSLRYDTGLDPVVTGATFNILAGEKIGICGRTGSGKSSLILSLFRTIDICEGEILIDGKDTSRIPLPDLRSKLAIIPQDPVLFSGTIRHNLDPRKELTDDQIWLALETVQMKDTIKALPHELESDVTEGGENFSVGQKQLFCLARAFLRNNKILVLDEATASIDLETDNKLQKVIATAFKDKTVITIAHRISTILKYDRVMVLDKGSMVEFDNPKSLTGNKDSLFYQLLHSTNKM